MLELNFVVFCITVIALTAIVFGKDDVAMKALTMMSETTKGCLSTFGNIFKHPAKYFTKDETKHAK